MTVKFDVAVFGRLCVDFYAECIGALHYPADRFVQAVGGCAGNIAIGCARLGLRSAIVSATGADAFGDYIRGQLIAEGVGTDGLRRVEGCRTALTFASAGSEGRPALTFFREAAADIVIDPDAVDTGLIAASRVLVLGGAHAAAGIGAAAAGAAVAAARGAGRLVVLDIDHRPAFGADGGAGAVAIRLQALVGAADIVCGTEMEFQVAAGIGDTNAALRGLRAVSAAVFVVKCGAAGALLVPDTVPDRLDPGCRIEGFEVAVRNSLGAGDAFLAGFIACYLNGAALTECVRQGNACGAIVAGLLLCSAACPYPADLAAIVAPGISRAGTSGR